MAPIIPPIKLTKSFDAYTLKYPFIKLFAYADRNGKSGVLNKLHQQLHTEYSPAALKNLVLVLTDANVFLEQETLFELAKHFKNFGGASWSEYPQ